MNLIAAHLTAEAQIVDLWPKGQVPLAVETDNDEFLWGAGAAPQNLAWWHKLSKKENLGDFLFRGRHAPALEMYQVSSGGDSPRAAVIIAPGGAYMFEAPHEGRALNSIAVWQI